MAYTDNLTPTLTSNTSNGVASASTEYSTTYAAWKSMDGVASYWRTSTGGVAPCTLAYRWLNWSAARAITQYAITSNAAADAPNDWIFQGSNDGSSWTDLDTQTDIVFGAAERKTFEFVNVTVYLYYRLSISSNNGATTTAISVFEMMATVDTDIQVAGVSLDTEIDVTDIQVAGLSLLTEIGIPDVQVAGLSLQVECIIPELVPITAHTVIIEILEYTSTEVAEAGTDTDTLIITGHGLESNDFIVNKTVRDAQDLNSAERGSRRISKTDDDTLELPSAIVGQTDTDEILLFHFTDVTDYLIDRTLNINLKASYNNSASFQLFLPIVADVPSFQFIPGQYVRITLDSVVRFLGLISDAEVIAINEVHPYIYQSINCVGLNGIPARRTITMDYASTATAGDIVTLINDSYLLQEGMAVADPLYITDGLTIGEAWKNDCVSISDILDECASRNGFQWFIDTSWRLNFYQDPGSVGAAPYDIDGSIYIRYKNLRLSHSFDNYVNKCFIVGGKDSNGNQIKTVNQNLTQENAVQEICGGSGVYGNVVRDSALTNMLSRAAGAGTALTNINIVGHGMVVGDYVYNKTLGIAFWVVTVTDADNFVINDTGDAQTPADVIITYPANDDLGLNILKRQKYMPKTVSFTIDYITWYPQMMQKIDLVRSGIASGYYNIDSVTIRAVGAGFYDSAIVAILRDENDFSTQGHPAFSEFMRGF